MGIIIFYLSCSLGIGRLSRPGPGMFPASVGSMLMLFSFMHMLNSLLSYSHEENLSISWPGFPALKRVIFVLMVLFVYVYSLNYIGFIIASFCMVLILIKIVGIKGWLFSIITASLIVGPIFMLFQWGLDIQLPTETLGF
jgi:putative tricarboxylic transport membrane protein